MRADGDASIVQARARTGVGALEQPLSLAARFQELPTEVQVGVGLLLLGLTLAVLFLTGAVKPGFTP
jgi:hypothetical protein